MASGGSLSFDDGRVIRAVSEAGAAALGRPRAELVGAPLRDILPLAARVFFDAHVWPRLALRGRADDVYLTLLGAGGRPVPVLLTATRDARGGVPRTECDFVVVRRRRPPERELARAAPDVEGAPGAKG